MKRAASLLATIDKKIDNENRMLNAQNAAPSMPDASVVINDAAQVLGFGGLQYRAVVTYSYQHIAALCTDATKVVTNQIELTHATSPCQSV